MRFDDRLKTVLAQRPQHGHDRAVRWRQLVELLARGGASPQTPLVEEAFDEAKREASSIDEQLRAATARAVAGAQLPVGLVALFAADNIAVAAPVLAAARLSPEQWSSVLEQASLDSRRFLRSLHPDLFEEQPTAGEGEGEGDGAGIGPPAAPPPDEPEQAVQPEETAQAPGAASSISETVARIERLRQERGYPTPGAAPAGEAAGPVEGPPLFRWECDPSGEIAWVDGVPRGALIGRSFAGPAEDHGVDERIRRAFAVRAPFRDGSLNIAGEGKAAGEWMLSGVPAFEPSDGRFAGYRGVAVRGGVPPAAAEPSRAARFDNDSIRDLVHELKTPLNAIIGFAEVIDGQYLGPADFSYRERAAEIVAQARLLLSAIEDLDFAAKIASTRGQQRQAVDLADIFERLAPSLRELAAAKGVILQPSKGDGELSIAADPELTERLISRMCRGMIDRAEPGELLRLSVGRNHDHCRVSIDRPAALEGLTDDALFGSGDDAIAEGFYLRLVRSLARASGAAFVSTAEQVALTFPAA